MSERVQLAAAVVAIAALGGAALFMEPPAANSGPVAEDASAVHVVTIRNMQFDPVELIVKRGSRVMWINQDLFAHTATDSGKTFDSGNIDADESWSYVAGKPGDYAYLCAFHPTMKGRLIVQ